MGRAWCLMKPGARALVGVPTGQDKICFNGNKLYGPILYKQIFANWNQVFTEVSPRVFSSKGDCMAFNTLDYQPMTILEKPQI